MRYPSIKTLMQIKDVTKEDAIAIRAIMAGPRMVSGLTRMERIDAILGTCGVEYIPEPLSAQLRGEMGISNRKSPAIHYCNAGDTYATTVLKVNGRFRVGCWGDIVERGNYD